MWCRSTAAKVCKSLSEPAVVRNVIQSHWRRRPLRSIELMRDAWNAEIADSSIACAAAALLQRHVKAYLTRLTFLKQQRSAVVIQSLSNNRNSTTSLHCQPVCLRVSQLCNPKTAHFDFKNCGDGKRIGEVLWNNGHLTISLHYQPIYMMVSWLCNEKTAHFGFKSDGGQQRHVSSYWIRQ